MASTSSHSSSFMRMKRLSLVTPAFVHKDVDLAHRGLGLAHERRHLGAVA